MLIGNQFVLQFDFFKYHCHTVCAATWILLNAFTLRLFSIKHVDFFYSKMNKKHLSFKYPLRLLIMESKLLAKMAFYSRPITDFIQFLASV